MNYRHVYHAGNFADVLKHAVLVAALQAMTRKDKPFFFLDTHAGRARYDLQGALARKGAESDAGIQRLMNASDLPPLVQQYVDVVRAFDADSGHTEPGRIRYYPGSPFLAAAVLRASDRAALCELEPGEAAALAQELRRDQRFAVHQRDGYEALKGLLPPSERRGVVLVDPPYETQEQELKTAGDAVAAAARRWPQGVYLVWYPIKQRAATQKLAAPLKSIAPLPVLSVELCIHPDDNRAGLNGCGLAIVNPPWQLDEALAPALPALHRLLSPDGAGRHSLEWWTRGS